jgi:hypothetical protein
MAKGGDVMNHLIPTGGWVIYEDNFDSIIYDEGVTPITKKTFEETLSKWDEIKAKKAADKAQAKAALLERLGISAEEAALLLG